MKKRFSLALMTAATITLAACGGGSSSEPPGPEIAELGKFTGDLSLNLAGFEITDQFEVNTSTLDRLQYLFFASSAQNVDCALGFLFHSADTSMDEQFALFSSEYPGDAGSIITTSSIAAPNGSGRELIHSEPLQGSNDGLTFISNLYHFTAPQMTTATPTSTLISCVTLTSNFSAGESVMRGVLGSVSFERDAPVAADVPWYATSFGPSDTAAADANPAVTPMFNALRHRLSAGSVN